jgi:hypothetical protein
MTRTPLDTSLKNALSLGTPVEVFDPVTNEVFYVINAEQFQRLASPSHGELDPSSAYPVVEQMMAEDDLHDPLLESYQ